MTIAYDEMTETAVTTAVQDLLDRLALLPGARAILGGDIVGIGDIASRLGEAGRPVTVGTVQSWRARAGGPDRVRAPGTVYRIPMPPPDGWISSSVPWWFWTATVLPWLVETGRI